MIVTFAALTPSAVVGAMSILNTRDTALNILVEQNETPKVFAPTPIVNKGKDSEKRDILLEQDILKINIAVQAYAEDHGGVYPKSDFQNPCSGVRFCLKSVDINNGKNVYLNPVPQVKTHNLDYYYRTDSKAKTYCIKTGFVLETAPTMIFQCTQDACQRMPFEGSCIM